MKVLLENQLSISELNDTYDISETIKSFLETWNILISFWIVSECEVILLIKMLMNYCEKENK